MKYLKKFEKFESNTDIESSIQNLVDIGFSFWEEEGRLFYEGELTIDSDVIAEIESSIKKVLACGHGLNVVKWNGNALAFEKDSSDTVYIHYPDLSGKPSEIGVSLTELLKYFKTTIQNSKVTIKFICLKIV
jgi:hypothetical protein